MTGIDLPAADGGWTRRTLAQPRQWSIHPQPFQSRVAFAAAHVVADPLAENVPGAPAVIDWEQTLAFRRHLFSYGMGVAEAMDTAQRNMGLDWAAAAELIGRSAAEARAVGARIASGAGTDQLEGPASITEIIAAYSEQTEVVQAAGSQVIVMASRQLAAAASSAEDFHKVYDAVLDQIEEPVILHWLGEVFDPQLRGYWGSEDLAVATATFLELVERQKRKIDGVKVSLLNAEHELALRAALPEGVRLYTGDDFNYPELIKGDADDYSDALLGAFAAIAPAASAALAALDRGDRALFDSEFAPTLPLARHIFKAPTWFYKTGIAFLSWISGHQAGFSMVGGLQSGRSLVHLAQILALADDARLLPDPELAAHRMGLLLAGAGVSR